MASGGSVPPLLRKTARYHSVYILVRNGEAQVVFPPKPVISTSGRSRQGDSTPTMRAMFTFVPSNLLSPSA
jgi:hypothetical protein